MLDALCQGVESYWSVKSTPESKAYACAAIEEVLRNAVAYLALDGHDSALVAASSSSVIYEGTTAQPMPDPLMVSASRLPVSQWRCCAQRTWVVWPLT